MNFIMRLFCVLLFLCNTTGCITQQSNSLTKDKTKKCQISCTQEFELCSKTCMNNCARCRISADNTAIMDYSKYIEEKRIVGGFITRGLKSYRDPLQCRKVTCNCTADLLTCTQNCTGIIHKSLRSVPLCN